MKKLLISILFLSFLPLFADNDVPNYVGEKIEFTTQIYHIDKNKNTHPKLPISQPFMTINSHTIHIYSQHSDFQLQLVQNEKVVYEEYIPEGTKEIQLPSTLRGDYALELYMGDFVFVGSLIF